MKDDDTRILDENAAEDTDTRIIEPTAAADESTRIETSADEPVSANVPEAPKKKSNAWIAWMIGIAVLGAAGAGAWCYFGNRNTDVNAQTDHSDDDEFENFGRVRRAIERNVENNDYSEPVPEYYLMDSVVPAAEAADYYYPEAAVVEEAVPAEEAVAPAEEYYYNAK